MDKNVSLIQINYSFDLTYLLGNLRGSSVIGATLLQFADSPILMASPHSVTQLQASSKTSAEFRTKAITETSRSMLNANVPTALSPRIETENAASPARLTQTPVLPLATRTIRLPIDIHGLSARRGVDINIDAGTSVDYGNWTMTWRALCRYRRICGGILPWILTGRIC